ncbi:MAG: DUF5605 domain-containing protein [Bacteroidota bacterium]
MPSEHSKHLIPFILILLISCSCSVRQGEVEQWDIFEIEMQGPQQGNPFRDVTLSAVFTHPETQATVTGFYDGNGIYRIRFMPEKTGKWTYETRSSLPELEDISGSFTCIEPAPGNHGPVEVTDTWHFEYADGTPYHQVGTTCYAWIHQGDSLEEVTLQTLSEAPFNKLRMCIFPKDYVYNQNEPEYYVFERDREGDHDFTQFSPAYFHHLEKRLRQLMDLGIQADLILFHPYDRWGYAEMPDSVDEYYLEYVMARLSSFRNVWWSAANEFDFMEAKTMDDWHRIFEVIYRNDPHGRLRSIHNGRVMYDHSHPWITHASIQSTYFDSARVWRQRYRKPVIFDECRYEGNIPQGWGNLEPEEMVSMFWKSLITGTYAGHGETYLHPDDILWWSKGGVLHGESPARIAFYKRILENAPEGGFEPFDRCSAGKYGEQYVYYFGTDKPESRTFDLPGERSYRVEIIDTWNMTIDTLDETFEGEFSIDLPGKPYMAVRITRTGLLFPVVKVRTASDRTLFYREIEAELVHPDPGQVFYTLDGSEPTRNSLQYRGPIKISERTVLKAVAFEGERKSDVMTAEYIPAGLNPAVSIEDLQSGLKYEYYTGDWDRLPDFSDLEAEKTGYTEKIGLDMAEDEDHFAIRYTGYIMIPGDQVYSFTGISDDGSFVFIDGKKIVDNDYTHAVQSVSGQIGLAAGLHGIEVQFFEKTGDQHLEVTIESEDMPEQPVTGDMLFHSRSGN